MSALVEFLHARLNEDEAWATAARGWQTGSRHEGQPLDWSIHMDRWAPDRVLADVAAKRRIVELHRRNVEADDCWSCGWVKSLPCDTVRALALPYADHPDYRQEWRP